MNSVKCLDSGDGVAIKVEKLAQCRIAPLLLSLWYYLCSERGLECCSWHLIIQTTLPCRLARGPLALPHSYFIGGTCRERSS